MKVFISWSGATSRQVALALHAWLPNVVQQADPWMSAADIEPGARWGAELARRLEETTFGILCITKDNPQAPWMLFEAGALSKTLTHTRVCPFLHDLEPADLTGPLVQFQAIRANEDGTRQLVQTLNRALDDHALPLERLDRAFELWWPDLDQRLKAISPGTSSQVTVRSDREILEEILETVRNQSRSNAIEPFESPTMVVMRDPTFRKGERVIHPAFGEGVIVTSTIIDDDEQVTVLFKKYPTPKRLSMSFAPLERA